MYKKSSRKHQKLYKMKGCSKKTRKNHLGGKSTNMTLAYPSNNVPTVPNPALAYTGKGGMTPNINAANPALPNSGPPANGFNFLNPQGSQRGGSCGCGMPLMNGGSKNEGSKNRGSRRNKKGGVCAMCGLGFMVGGNSKHREGCRCSICKMKGGANLSNNGIPYPDGLVGNAWTPKVTSWPGVNGVPGDSNYLAYNTYPTDISRQMIATGANPPFSVGGKRRQKGGVTSNFIGQDLINLGRQFQYGIGSAYNALAGYHAPVNPMPWKDQLPNTSNLSTIKAMSI